MPRRFLLLTLLLSGCTLCKTERRVCTITSQRYGEPEVCERYETREAYSPC